MKRFIQLQPHPFRLLLYLEWILLGLSAFKIFGFPGLKRPIFSGGTKWFTEMLLKPETASWLIVLLLVFGVMGLRLPKSRWVKWLYTGFAFGLIGAIANFQGWGLDSISPLLVVMLLRSSLMFQRKGRWIVGSLMWLVYPLTLTPFMLILWFIFHPEFINHWKSELNSGIIITPSGGIQINFNFSPEQVQQFLLFIQKFIVYILVDNLLSFGLILIFVLLLVNSLVSERQGRRKLAQAHEQLYQYSLQIEDQATLQERTRIAREIHDSLGHLLTAQNIQLQNASLLLYSNIEETNTFLEHSKILGKKALEELRQSIAMLRSDPLEGRSLEAAMSSLLEEFSQISNISPHSKIKINSILPARMQVAIYRILEEALTNIYKYSHATKVNIKLEIIPTSSHPNSLEIALQIEDNGIGFNIEQNATGFGLRGMQERAESLGGKFQVITKPQAGCRILIYFPMPLIYP